MNGRTEHGIPKAFIGGFRSGTTLLVNLMGMHPQVSAWYEAKFLAEALRWMRVLQFPGELEVESGYCAPPQPPGFTLEAVAGRMRSQMEYDDARVRGFTDSGKAVHERYPLGADRIHYSLNEALSALGRWQSTLKDGVDSFAIAQATDKLIQELGSRHLQAEPGKLLINKTPELTRFGCELRSSIGPHKMILMVRDGREVVRSASALRWAEPVRLAYLWRELILQSREAARTAPEDYLEIRYEDLISDPSLIVDRICRFLAIPLLGGAIVRDYERQLGIAISPRTARCPYPDQAEFDEIAIREAGDMLQELGYLDR